MLEFINIIMCHDLLSPKQPRHQSTFCCCFDLTFWGEKKMNDHFFFHSCGFLLSYSKVSLCEQLWVKKP